MEKYGFVYLWYDVKHKRYYVGCHWGTITDGYICSSNWMRDAYNRRPEDFRRRILKTNLSREQMYIEEQRYLDMQKLEEKKIRYYNLNTKNGNPWHKYPDSVKTIGQKISYSKTGKSVPAPPDRGAKISAAKKGKALTEEHKAALKGIKKKPHTEEWKQQNSIRIKGNKFSVGRKHMNDGQKNYFVTEKDIQEKNLFHLVTGRLKVGA
jgi:hypothetical protein